MKNIYLLMIPVFVSILFMIILSNSELLDFEKGEKDGITEKKLIQNGSPILGDKNAKITILEFGDHQCTFCYKFHKETLPILKNEK